MTQRLKVEEIETSLTFQLALQLIQHFGIVAAKDVGTSETGQTILKLQEPAELVERAFSIAQLAVDEGFKRGLIRKV